MLNSIVAKGAVYFANKKYSQTKIYFLEEEIKKMSQATATLLLIGVYNLCPLTLSSWE